MKKYISTHKDEEISSWQYGEGDTPEEAYEDWVNGEGCYDALEWFGSSEGDQIEVTVWTVCEVEDQDQKGNVTKWACEKLVETKLYTVTEKDVLQFS